MKIPSFKLLLLLAVFGATSASADLIYNFTNHPDGMHVDVLGSLDTSFFTFFGSGNSGNSTHIDPYTTTISIGPSPAADADFYTVPDGTLQSLGSSTADRGGTYVYGFIVLDANGSGPDAVLLPSGYVSGDSLNASAIFPGTTLADYGFPNSDVVSHLPGNQTITFHFAPVPDTGSTLLLLAVGLGGVALVQRRRRGLAT